MKVTSLNAKMKKVKQKYFIKLIPRVLPMISSFESHIFYNNILSTLVFAKLLKEHLKSTVVESELF